MPLQQAHGRRGERQPVLAGELPGPRLQVAHAGLEVGGGEEEQGVGGQLDPVADRVAQGAPHPDGPAAGRGRAGLVARLEQRPAAVAAGPRPGAGAGEGRQQDRARQRRRLHGATCQVPTTGQWSESSIGSALMPSRPGSCRVSVLPSCQLEGGLTNR